MNENCVLISDLIYSINNKLEEQVSEIFLPLNITLNQARIIYQIYHGQDVTIQRLTHDLNLSYPNCSNILKRMEKANLIQRIKTFKDQRFVTLKLTRKSLAIVEEINVKIESLYDECFKAINQSDMKKIIQSLKHLNITLGGE